MKGDGVRGGDGGERGLKGVGGVGRGWEGLRGRGGEGLEGSEVLRGRGCLGVGVLRVLEVLGGRGWLGVGVLRGVGWAWGLDRWFDNMCGRCAEGCGDGPGGGWGVVGEVVRLGRVVRSSLVDKGLFGLGC